MSDRVRFKAPPTHRHAGQVPWLMRLCQYYPVPEVQARRHAQPTDALYCPSGPPQAANVHCRLTVPGSGYRLVVIHGLQSSLLRWSSGVSEFRRCLIRMYISSEHRALTRRGNLVACATLPVRHSTGSSCSRQSTLRPRRRGWRQWPVPGIHEAFKSRRNAHRAPEALAADRHGHTGWTVG